MAVELAGATDVGRKRDHNEDALLILPEHQVAAVCDGMGGHAAGEVASGIAVETIRKFFELAKDEDSTWPFRYDPQKDEGSNLLSVAAQWANQRIRDAAQPGGQGRRGMGTTFVGCVVRGRKAWFGWVGDSRGYLFRRGELRPTTTDHSLLNELIQTGRLSSREEIENFQHKNVITRALGMGDHIDVEVSTSDLESGDVCLVCCDGLTGMVSDERMAEILAAQPDLRKACQELVGEANDNGGIDNITVALLRYS